MPQPRRYDDPRHAEITAHLDELADAAQTDDLPSPETRARIAKRIGERFHEITGTPLDPS
ncbi:hypothetical protein [Embleya sp. NPDC001921]